MLMCFSEGHMYSDRKMKLKPKKSDMHGEISVSRRNPGKERGWSLLSPPAIISPAFT